MSVHCSEPAARVVFPLHGEGAEEREEESGTGRWRPCTLVDSVGYYEVTS